MIFRNSLIASILVMVLTVSASAQEIQRSLDSFTRVIASPKINLVLNHGEKEEIKLVYNNVDREKVNIRVQGNTLRIYLDGAKVTEKTKRMGQGKRSVYTDAVITAYVTYTKLEHVEIRGDQELTCLDAIEAEQFKIKAYGENQITFASVNCEYLKTQLYGENNLRIKEGKVDFQKYKLYGENRIDTRGLRSYATAATIYGESKVRINSQDALRVNAFGEADVSFLGNAYVSKGWIFGKTNIRRIEN